MGAQEVLARLRTLASEALQVLRAGSEEEVFEAVGRATLDVGFNVHIDIFDEQRALLVVRHVALHGDLARFERLLGRPIVGITLDPEAISVYREALRSRAALLAPSVYQWLVEALPWLSARARRALAHIRVGQGACAPLLAGERLLGALSFWGPDLVAEDLPTLEIFAAHTGLALERLQLGRGARDAARLEGALLAAHTMAHHLNNQLALTVGYSELLAHDPALPERLRPLALQALEGAEAAARTLAALQDVARLEETPGPIQPLLDIERSRRREPQK